MEQLKNFFKFLEDKEGKNPPLKYKLIYDQESLTLEDLNFKGFLDLRDTSTPITSLPDGLTLDGGLSLARTKIVSLPDNLTVSQNLHLNDTNITSLPNNLTVGDTLYMQDTKINSIPNNLEIGRNFWLYRTPLFQKYSEAQIIKMIQDKGGYIKGKIVM
jgi:hypothetical protein